MDNDIELRRQDDYVVGDWVLFTTGASTNRPGYVQYKFGGPGTDNPVRYEIMYKRWIPGPRMTSESPVTYCTAGQLIKVVDTELTRTEFLSLAPRDVNDRYLNRKKED